MPTSSLIRADSCWRVAGGAWWPQPPPPRCAPAVAPALAAVPTVSPALRLCGNRERDCCPPSTPGVPAPGPAGRRSNHFASRPLGPGGPRPRWLMGGAWWVLNGLLAPPSSAASTCRPPESSPLESATGLLVVPAERNSGVRPLFTSRGDDARRPCRATRCDDERRRRRLVRARLPGHRGGRPCAWLRGARDDFGGASRPMILPMPGTWGHAVSSCARKPESSTARSPRAPVWWEVGAVDRSAERAELARRGRPARRGRGDTVLVGDRLLPRGT